MSCLNPRGIINPRYRKMTNTQIDEYVLENHIEDVSSIFTESKSGFHIPHFRPHDYYLQVPCGKCSECKRKYRLSWSIRLLKEINFYRSRFGDRSVTFITLTFDDLNLARFKDNVSLCLNRYIDRIRKASGVRPRYFFCTELGSKTHRLHLHGLIFNSTDISPTLQREKWTYGFSYIGYCTERTANYVTKYLLKQSLEDESDFYKPRIFVSNGLGLSYVNADTIEYHINGFEPIFYIWHNGHRYPLADYYKRKLFTDDIRLVFSINRARSSPPTSWRIGTRLYTDFKEYLKDRSYLYARERILNNISEIKKDDSFLCKSIPYEFELEYPGYLDDFVNCNISESLF